MDEYVRQHLYLLSWFKVFQGPRTKSMLDQVQTILVKVIKAWPKDIQTRATVSTMRCLPLLKSEAEPNHPVLLWRLAFS